MVTLLSVWGKYGKWKQANNGAWMIITVFFLREFWDVSSLCVTPVQWADTLRTHWVPFWHEEVRATGTYRGSNNEKWLKGNVLPTKGSGNLKDKCRERGADLCPSSAIFWLPSWIRAGLEGNCFKQSFSEREGKDSALLFCMFTEGKQSLQPKDDKVQMVYAVFLLPSSVASPLPSTLVHTKSHNPRCEKLQLAAVIVLKFPVQTAFAGVPRVGGGVQLPSKSNQDIGLFHTFPFSGTKNEIGKAENLGESTLTIAGLFFVLFALDIHSSRTCYMQVYVFQHKTLWGTHFFKQRFSPMSQKLHGN